MFLFNIQNKDDLYNCVHQELRSKGIKHSRVKKANIKQVDKNAINSSTFKRPIESLTTTSVEVNCGAYIEIPLILWQICDYIRQHVETEGLFRKAGSAARQKEIRKIIEKEGELLDYKKHHVIDIANILKLFLRELPEPLLPYQFHDTFLRCLLLKTNQLESLLLVCLLMPSRNLSTLTFLMEFLNDVAAHSEKNLMDVLNLAIIFTPSIMPVGEKLGLQAGTRLTHHVKVIEHLINNFHKIGFLPNCLSSWSSLSSVPTEEEKSNEESNKLNKKKKKRRSGSLTRMFSGLKKMVSKTTSDQDEDCLITNETTIYNATPLIKSTKKRKNEQEISQSKKKRDFLQGFSNGLSFGSPMIFTPPCTQNPVHGSTSSIVFSNPNPSTSVKLSPNRSKRRFFNVKLSNERELTKSAKVKRRSVTSLITSKKNARKSFDLPDTYSSEKNSRKKLSESFSPVLLSSSSLSISLSDSDHIVNLSDQSNNLDEFVRIPKREYEEIKERVSLIESHISELTTMREDEKVNNSLSAMNTNLVQSVYEQTLEESRPLDDPGTEQLARKLSRELRIRRSQSNRIIRSPSARKIGTIRRRSRESARNQTLEKLASMTSLHQMTGNQTNEQFYPRISLRRGQPNTVYSGLRPPSTPGRSLDNALYDEKNTPKVTRSSSFHGSENTPKQKRFSSNVTEIITPAIYQHNYDSNWQNAEGYFAEKMATSEETIPPTGRESVVRLRNQNAGLVLQRMKLFDSQNPTPKLTRSGQLRKEALERRYSLRLMNREKKIKTNSQGGKENLISPNNNNNHNSNKNNNINFKSDDIPLTKMSNNSLIKTPSPNVISSYHIKTRGSSISPLKDNNRIESDILTPIIGPSIINNGRSSRREMPIIKRSLVTGKTPQSLLTSELVRRSSPRRRDNGPFKALPISINSATVQSLSTPSPRRSPRGLKSRNLTRVLN